MNDFPFSQNAENKFNGIVNWLVDLIKTQDCPGLIMGLSGTDSILAFVAAAQSFEQLGKLDRLQGIHYAKPFQMPLTERDIKVLDNSPTVAWFQRSTIPWLQEKFPGASIVIDGSINYRSDACRWADLFDRSLNGALPTEELASAGTYWVMGTRNRTESKLLTYSNISTAASVQPLVDLWKKDVLMICRYLGVPEIAIEQSRQVDCDCGRFDLAAAHIEEIDLILMSREGIIDPGWLQENIEEKLLKALVEFVNSQQAAGKFKTEIPYTPTQELIT